MGLSIRMCQWKRVSPPEGISPQVQKLGNPGKSLFYIDLLKSSVLDGHFQCVVMVKKP
jgi:hypothetical protein